MPTTVTGSPRPMDSETVPLTDADGFRDALLQLLRDARRQLRIYSQELARELYSDPAVVQGLSDFARSSRYAHIQILITDSDPVLRRPHRLIPLVQRLGSRIELKKIQPSTEPSDWEFALADREQVIQRSDTSKWIGSYHLQNAVRVRQLQDVFEQAWVHARPDPELKRFLL